MSGATCARKSTEQRSADDKAKGAKNARRAVPVEGTAASNISAETSSPTHSPIHAFPKSGRILDSIASSFEELSTAPVIVRISPRIRSVTTPLCWILSTRRTAKPHASDSRPVRSASVAPSPAA